MGTFKVGDEVIHKNSEPEENPVVILRVTKIDEPYFDSEVVGFINDRRGMSSFTDGQKLTSLVNSYKLYRTVDAEPCMIIFDQALTKLEQSWQNSK